jgi:hypothetical protein
MNINIKPTTDKNPFDQSDRDAWHPHAGKGDRDRSNTPQFKSNYEAIDWGKRERKPGKQTFFYGTRAPKLDGAPFILTSSSRAKPKLKFKT